MILNEKIKELRIEKGATQKELANFLKVDISIVSKWELGKRRPNYEDLIKMAKYFDVTVGYLLGVED